MHVYRKKNFKMYFELFVMANTLIVFRAIRLKKKSYVHLYIIPRFYSQKNGCLCVLKFLAAPTGVWDLSFHTRD